jgi:hypothetical protein
MNEECCNHNCNQGRDCPLRKTELTDDEIIHISLVYDLDNVLGLIDFARAILRKAQEK